MSLSCDPGFQIVGNSVQHCLNMGQWTRPFPRCESELFQWAGRVRKHEFLFGPYDCSWFVYPFSCDMVETTHVIDYICLISYVWYNMYGMISSNMLKAKLNFYWAYCHLILPTFLSASNACGRNESIWISKLIIWACLPCGTRNVEDTQEMLECLNFKYHWECLVWNKSSCISVW